MESLALVDISFGILFLYIVKMFFMSKTSTPLPPGPKPKPLMGNIMDLPPAGVPAWIHWGKHKALYGPISSVTVFGRTLIIINDHRIAFDLMEKRSAVYSSRPRMAFAGEMIGWENALGLLSYSDRFRFSRRHVHSVLGTKQAVSRFNDLQGEEVRRFLSRVLDEPDRLVQHIRTEAGAIILKISYGYTIEPHGRDPLIDLADETMVQGSLATIPGTWLADSLPFLKHVPEWMPGTGFKRTAAHWKKTLIEFTEIPYAFVKQQMAAGVAAPSYVSALLEKGHLSPDEESIIKWSAASLYAGGSDTTVYSLSCFFLAMAIYPEVPQKAQEEIDCVIGNDRLPSFEDRDNLPYINAIVKESIRWHPVTPTGLPHMTSEDDTYEGYHIPKGSVIIPNIWEFTHNETTYHDPMTFKPERFLKIDDREPEMDPHRLVFGFGRRICPGRELADASLYMTIAQSLSVFNISKAVEDGKDVEPVVAFAHGVVSHPLEYEASVKSRNSKAEALIRTVEVDYPFQSGDSKALTGIEV